MKNCPKCNSPATNDGQPSNRQFYSCDSFGYAAEKLAYQTDLCAAWAAIRAVQQIVTTDHETKGELIARIKSILA